jgi:hypothetical protein
MGWRGLYLSGFVSKVMNLHVPYNVWNYLPEGLRCMVLISQPFEKTLATSRGIENDSDV